MLEDVGLFFCILSIFRPFDICYGDLVYFVVIGYIFTRFGKLYPKKSGNPNQSVDLFTENDVECLLSSLQTSSTYTHWVSVYIDISILP
jgi:hypothetical protein